MKFARFCELGKALAKQYNTKVTVSKDGDKYVMRVPGLATFITSKNAPKFTVKWGDGHMAMVESEFLDAFIPAKGSVSV